MATNPEDLGQPTGGLADAMLAGAGAGETVDTPATPTPEPEPQFVDETYQDPNETFGSEEEELLFGPTLRPNDVPGQRPSTGRKKVPAPRGMEKYYSIFSEAAREPNAPPELQAFMRQLSYHLSREA